MSEDFVKGFEKTMSEWAKGSETAMTDWKNRPKNPPSGINLFFNPFPQGSDAWDGYEATMHILTQK